jgi:hypothetical protein
MQSKEILDEHGSDSVGVGHDQPFPFHDITSSISFGHWFILSAQRTGSVAAAQWTARWNGVLAEPLQ